VGMGVDVGVGVGMGVGVVKFAGVDVDIELIIAVGVEIDVVSGFSISSRVVPQPSIVNESNSVIIDLFISSGLYHIANIGLN